MNKKVLFGMFGLAAGSLMADNVATTATFNPYAKINGAYTFAHKKEGLKYKNGFAGTVEMGVSYESFRLGLEAGYRQNKIKNQGDNVWARGFAAGYDKVNALSAMVNVYYDYALTDEFSLYLGLGLGAAKVAFHTRGNADMENISKTVFAWQVMAGVAYDITENWSVEAGYRLFNTSKVKTAQDTKKKMPFVSSLELGLRYNF